VTLLIYNQNIIKKHEALPIISLQPIFIYRKAISKAKIRLRDVLEVD
jgi:hypothetical protein